MIQYYGPSTGENIKNILLDVLDEFGLFSKNIVSITVDNGRNVVKSVESLNEDLNVSESSDYEVSEENENDSILKSDIINNFYSEIILIRCAAHTLQIAINSFLKNASFPLKKLKEGVKILRQSKYRQILKEKSIAVPPLENLTRWGSFYLMLSGFLKCKEIIIEYSQFDECLKINESDFKTLFSISEVLEECYNSTIKMQRKNFPLTDFFHVFKRLEVRLLELQNINPFAQELLNVLLSKCNNLLSSESMIAAIYLDPRFHFLLSDEQKKTALLYLENMYVRMFGNVSQESVNRVAERDESNVKDNFEVYLMKKEAETMHPGIMSIQDTFKDFCSRKRLHPNDDVIAYWNNNGFANSNLVAVANAILSIPGTQVSVERSFSDLKFILNDFRTKIDEFLLDSVLFLRINNRFIDGQ